ncbi:Uncharacterized protein BP5553_00869 [Venustampulla echinocandica]|uniref:DUF924-domain-containing protein n=1 Tax=Venustampulla echinocandica TaxID=2656787 RepID=A0A370TZF4_9HELO|nr:Uncharacterized protein BP5553_00869 [Venustampulla echinocandica]RDL40890.1 Uncharacterized protein BP5553_00869 [Venustampulla echinocandica]
MSSLPSTELPDPEINRIISYWFGGDDLPRKWFQGGAKIDAEIKDQFGGLVEKARSAQLTSWTQQPQGTLALIILLDQFPRNIFRGTPLSFSTDPMALDITTQAIARGADREVPHIQQPFFYLPLMHHENLISQAAGCSLYEGLAARCEAGSQESEFARSSLDFARRHRDCIMKFGRFPSRNEILGRESTPEELEYLKEHPHGF